MLEKRAGAYPVLPVYMLLDLSGSMDGPPIDALHSALSTFLLNAATSPHLEERIRLCIITFDSQAAQLTTGLQKPSAVKLPTLNSGGVTRLDLALDLLNSSIQRDVPHLGKQGVVGQPVLPEVDSGSFLLKPIVFVLTDGYPTDETGEPSDAAWHAARAALFFQQPGHVTPCEIIAVGCGSDIDDRTLREISTGPYFRISGSTTSFTEAFERIWSVLEHWSAHAPSAHLVESSIASTSQAGQAESDARQSGRPGAVSPSESDRPHNSTPGPQSTPISELLNDPEAVASMLTSLSRRPQ